MLATLALVCASVLQRGVDDVGPLLQPATYTSPSGEWQLSVDPTRRTGAGPGRYRLTKSGAVIWEGEQTFTLCDADVDDRGYVGGHTNALAGVRGGEVEEICVVISPSGEYRVCGASARAVSAGDMRTEGQLLCGTYVHTELDRFVVRIASVGQLGRDKEDWRVFRLSTGELIEHVDPTSMLEAKGEVGCSLAAAPVRGTSLTIVQWWRRNFASGAEREHGARFVLCDAQWKHVWSLDLPRDFVGSEDIDANSHLFNEMLRGGALIRVDRPRQFAIRHCADNVVVTYEVTEDKAASLGWRVAEVARRPFELPKAPNVFHARLHEIAAVPLKLPWNTEPIRDILALGFDARGQLRFVRGEKDSRVCSLVTLDADYKIVSEQRIGPIAPDVSGEFQWTLLSRGDWLVTFRPLDGTKGSAWRADNASGRFDDLGVFDGAVIDRAAATSDGGFVAKATIRTYSATRHIVARVDADGRKLWELEGSPYSDARGMADTSAVAVAANGDTLLANGSIETDHMLHISAGVEFLDSINLPRAWKIPDLKVCELAPEPAGSTLAVDSSNRAVLHRINVEGELLADIKLQIEQTDLADSWLSSWHCDRSGNLWCSDGQRLICFDDKGALKAKLGVIEDVSRVRYVGWAGFNKSGHVGVGTSPNEGFHVFTVDGHEVPNAGFAPSDFGYHQPIPTVGPVHGWIHREGQPRVEKQTADGEVALTIDRRHDGRFFRVIAGIGVALDGTLAVFEREAPTGDVGNYQLHFYAPEGQWLKSVALTATRNPDFGSPKIEFGTHWILVHQWITEKALLVPWPDGRPLQVDAPIEAKVSPWSSFALSPDESELWCVTYAPPVLHRYELPK